jgi:hypothetical protein
MKRIVIFAGIALSAAAAHAEPITVMTPKAGATAEESAKYIADLDRAVKIVCQKAAAPVIGVNYYTYLACLKDTRADVGKKDPTGLYASRESAGGTVIAAK